MGLALDLGGGGEQAKPWLDLAVRTLPGEAWPYVMRGLCLRRSGELEEARRDLDQALGLEPDPQVLALRAGIFSDLGYVLEAISDLDEAIRLGGQRPDLLARRAQFHLQRRNYPQARSDLDRAISLSPGDSGLLAKRAELFVLTNSLARAQEDLEQALRLSPADEALLLARLRLFLQRGRHAAAASEIRRLMKASPGAASQALFYRGCLAMKTGRPGLGAADFLSLARSGSDGLALKARLYWLASRSVDPRFRRRHGMKDPSQKSAKLYLCGLGIFPPYTASLEVLHALSLCEVLFNNVAGEEVRELLSEFCGDVRPASYQAWQDEPRWADRIFRELRKGLSVGFVTRGHPLVFGGLAVELLRRCRAQGVPHETFGAVSSIDHLLAAMGKGLGDDFKGIQAFDRPAIEEARALNTREPLLVCFYSGLEGPRVEGFSRSLARFYPLDHECRMFGPKYDTPPAALRLGELARLYPEIHASLMLYVPPLRNRDED